MEINEVIQDFQRRYANTYLFVQFPDSSEESLFYIRSIQSDPDKLAVIQLESPEFGRISLNYGTNHTLRFKYPPVGVFQNGSDAFLFRRTPARQWRRGICPDNADISPVWSFYYPQPRRFDFEMVAAAYEAKKYKLSGALKMLASGKYRSVALEDNFSLCLNLAANKGYTLFHWDRAIASITENGKLEYLYESVYESVINNYLEGNHGSSGSSKAS